MAIISHRPVMRYVYDYVQNSKGDENLKERLRDKDKKIDSLEEKLNDADRRSFDALKLGNHNEQYSRKHNIRMLNFPERKDENLRGLCETS